MNDGPTSNKSNQSCPAETACNCQWSPPATSPVVILPSCIYLPVQHQVFSSPSTLHWTMVKFDRTPHWKSSIPQPKRQLGLTYQNIVSLNQATSTLLKAWPPIDLCDLDSCEEPPLQSCRFSSAGHTPHPQKRGVHIMYRIGTDSDRVMVHSDFLTYY